MTSIISIEVSSQVRRDRRYFLLADWWWGARGRTAVPVCASLGSRRGHGRCCGYHWEHTQNCVANLVGLGRLVFAHNHFASLGNWNAIGISTTLSFFWKANKVSHKITKFCKILQKARSTNPVYGKKFCDENKLNSKLQIGMTMIDALRKNSIFLLTISMVFGGQIKFTFFSQSARRPNPEVNYLG